MRPANPRQEEVAARVAGTFLLQRFFGTLSGIAAVMHFPIALVAQSWPLAKGILVLAGLFLFVLAFLFNRGVAGLVEGTADHSVRRAVKLGTRVSWILVTLTPLSLLATILNPELEARPLWLILLFLGAAILVAYFRQTKKYWIHVQSVA